MGKPSGLIEIRKSEVEGGRALQKGPTSDRITNQFMTRLTLILSHKGRKFLKISSDASRQSVGKV